MLNLQFLTVLLVTFHCISNVKKMYIFAVYKQFSCFELKQPYLLISTFTCGGRFILLCSPMHLYIFRTFEDLKKKLFYRVISHNDLQCPSLPVSNCMKEIFLRLNVSVTQNVSSESSF